MKKLTKKEYDAFRKRENERKQRWRKNKRLEVLKSQRTELQKLLPSASEPEKKKFKIRFNRHPKVTMAINKVIPVAHEPVPDVITEQVEKPMTTAHCPESIKKEGLSDVKGSPEKYIEINMITKSRVVDSFYILSERKKFHYKSKEYQIQEEAIYLLPTKIGYFVPSSYYKEGIPLPKGFKQTNKGITGKALSLLYMEQLYTSLLYTDETRYNLFIVILSIALLIIFSAGLFLTIFHNGGVFKPPVPLPEVPVSLIRMIGVRI